MVRPTTFQTGSTAGTDKRIEFQSLYQLLVDDETRNRAICEEVVQAVRDGRSPLILTERNEHLDRFESVLSAGVPRVVVLRGGMGKKRRRLEAERLATIPREEGRVILLGRMEIDLLCADSRISLRSMVVGISRIRSRTGATDARITYCKRAVISCCAILPRTWPRNWTQCSTGFCARSVPARNRLW